MYCTFHDLVLQTDRCHKEGVMCLGKVLPTDDFFPVS